LSGNREKSLTLWHYRAVRRRTPLPPRMLWQTWLDLIQALLPLQMVSSTNQQIILAAHISRLCWQILSRVDPCSRTIAAWWLGEHDGPMKHFIPRSGVRSVYPIRLWHLLHLQRHVQLALPTCGTCRLATPRPFVCLDCAYSGCWQDDHVVEHLNDENHRFCAHTYPYYVLASNDTQVLMHNSAWSFARNVRT